MKLIKSLLITVGSLILISCNTETSQNQEKQSIIDTTATQQKVIYTGSDADKINQVMEQVPDVEAPTLDLAYATSLAALPLSCLDRPQKQSDYKGYLYKRTVMLKPAYEDSLSFYGCYDWHSAVNSTWAMVSVYKEYPDMVLGGLIEEKLDNHLSEGSIEGELNFFKEIASPGFERPYGWAWYLNLYVELASWDTQKANEWSSSMKPLAEYFAAKMIPYLDKLDYPLRVGTHGNTAFSLSMIRNYAMSVDNDSLINAIDKNSKRFFMQDVECPASYEPSGSDFLSPCLAEAVLMSSVLTPNEFYEWFNTFMPAPYTTGFKSLRKIPEILFEKKKPDTSDKEDSTQTQQEKEREKKEKEDLMGAKSHLVGLAFYRASAFNQLAKMMPDNDPRKELYNRLADYHGNEGFNSLYKTNYLGTHWLGTYAVLYLQTLDD